MKPKGVDHVSAPALPNTESMDCQWFETIVTMAIRGESLSMLCQYLGSHIFHVPTMFEMVDVVAIKFHHVG